MSNDVSFHPTELPTVVFSQSEIFVIHMNICKTKKNIFVLCFNFTNHVSCDVAFRKIRLLQTAEDVQVTAVHCM